VVKILTFKTITQSRVWREECRTETRTLLQFLAAAALISIPSTWREEVFHDGAVQISLP
jgi:hypothetical protein